MNDTQKLIKKSIESAAREILNVDLVVEYVGNVLERVRVIEKIYGIKFGPVYNTENVTGTFVPSVNGSPYYLLIQQNRNDMLDVMTVFHEYRHLVDYIQFKDTVYKGNIEEMKDDPIYVTFNVYSEYAATFFGVQQYFRNVSTNSMTSEQLAKLYFKQANSEYLDFTNIINRYQLLRHSLVYLGELLACSEFIENFDVNYYIDKMELSDELKPIICNILQFTNEKAWYELNDKMMRTFVDGGDSVEIPI